MNARANIMQRLRDVRVGEAIQPSGVPDVAGHYQRHRTRGDAATRLAAFRSAIEAAHAEVHDTDPLGWPDVLRRIAAEAGVRRLLVGTGTAEAAQLAAADSGALELVAYANPAETWRDELFTDIDAGLSVARSAIAATGSLVLWTGPNEPRLMSLVPPIHFVLLDAGKLHEDLHDAMSAEGWPGSLPTNALLISGPSKTADIQQTLAYGAHGPRRLVVLLIHASGAHA